MKKILILSVAFLLVAAGAGLAKELDGLEGLIDLSKNVDGTYFSTPATSPTDFVISTAHTQGDLVYATGNFTTSIWQKDISGTSFVSSDLITSEPSNFDSSAFSGFSEM